MSEGRLNDLDAEGNKEFDPPIKLFGRDIPVTSTCISSCAKACHAFSVQGVKLEATTCGAEMDAIISDGFGSSSGSIDSCNEENPNAGTIVTESLKDGTVMTSESILMKGNDSKRHDSIDKMLKKPDKLLPCPRCNSLETKFCYFNNYNVNQPRHFCKKCQRYWTAGGSLRNVPVGAGRRKNKHSILHQKHVMADILTVRADARDLAHHSVSSSVTTTSENTNSQAKKQASMQSRLELLAPDACSFSALDSSSTSSTMLNFGQESPLCENMAAASLVKTNLQNCGSNKGWTAHHSTSSSSMDLKPSTQGSMLSFSNQPYESKTAAGSHLADTKVDVAASGNTSTVGMQTLENTLNGPANTEVKLKDDGYTLNIGGPWPHGLNLAWNPAPLVATDSPKFDGPGPMVPFPNPLAAWNGDPRGLWAGFPWPLAMWAAQWPGSWSVPWGPAAAAAAMGSLQKHQPESSRLQHGNSRCIWVPKTLRIDDPVEAARSSIWTTLGLGDGPGASATAGSIATKVFKSKTETVDIETAGITLHANPAAMSRSMTFHESS